MIELKNIMLFATAFAPSLTGAEELLNIIYIVIDQQTASAMSCMGDADLHTPNMDRLAQPGVLFRDAYCSAPLSGPSRASMFTGYTSHEVGLARSNVPMADPLRTAGLGWLVQNAGYECAHVGKWHVHTLSIPDGEFGSSAIHPHNDSGLAEAFVAFLGRKHSKPLSLVVGFDNPHNICEYARSQNLSFGNLPELSQDEWPGLSSNFARNPYDTDVINHEQGLNYLAYPIRHYSPDDWRRYRSFYFRLVKKVDAEIGKIVDAVDRRNLWRSTVIIFTSDHGDGVGAHHWNQKPVLYEKVVNVPLIVALPGKKNTGKEMPQLINTGVDFFASVCDRAGIPLPGGLHGISFKALVENADPEQMHQPYVVAEATFDKGVTHGWASRIPHYRYVLYDKGLYHEQLYDMEKDRGEVQNLAIEKKYQEILAQHRAYLSEWMRLHHVIQIRPEVRLIPGM